MIDAKHPQQSLLLRKPLATKAGGSGHKGTDAYGRRVWAPLGYGPRFGIIDVDRSTQRRIVKPSGEWLGRIARANAFPLPT